MDLAAPESARPGSGAPAPPGREHLVFFGIRPWAELARFGFYRTAGATFGCLLRSGRFASATYVTVARRWGSRVVVEAIGDRAVALELPAGLPLGRFSSVRHLNRLLQVRLLARCLSRQEGRERLFWLQDWEQIGVAGRLGPGRCLVECQDDPEQVLAGYPSRLREIPANRAAALARADLVAAVDASLLDGLGEGGSRFVLAPNGLSGEFLEAGTRAWPEPAELAGHPHPRLVVVAGEWSFDRRVDHALLEAVMSRLAGWSLVLVGVPGKPGPSLARLAERPGVVALRPRPYLDLVPLLRACDVGAVPYRAAGRRDTLKTYEYLACGLPVVATYDEPRPELSPWVRLAVGPEAFASACAASLRDGLRPGPLRTFLGECTWERRTSRLLAALDALHPPGAR
jgi:glycosyltransferase involved in cell wall biosynthesis